MQLPNVELGPAPQPSVDAENSVELEPCLNDDPESLALRILQATSTVSQDDLLKIVALLPGEEEATRGAANGSAFYAGAYRRGGIMGLRKNTHAYPSVCKLLRVVRETAPEVPFTSVVVLSNVQTPLHKDLRNPLSQFAQGGIWCEDKSGADMRRVHNQLLAGRVLTFETGHILLPASKCWHQTEP